MYENPVGIVRIEEREKIDYPFQFTYVSFGEVNTLRPRQICCHFADDIFKSIFFNENIRISLKISLKFVPNFRINNITALVQIMAWYRPGDKPLSEPVMVSLLTPHEYVTRPQWDKALQQNIDASKA